MAKVDFPGYFTERMKSGNLRHRVRVEGNKAIKITLPYGPEDARFQATYIAARAGIKPDRQQAPIKTKQGSVGWLITAYLANLLSMVDTGQRSPLTYKQRKPMGDHLMAHRSTSGNSNGRLYRDLPMMIPTHELIAYRDSLMSTPGQAANTFKFIKAMYQWAVERGHCDHNPAAGISVEYVNQGGATPWTLEELKTFMRHHPLGTDAHLCMALFSFTACRISDAIRLGRSNEITVNGQKWLSWSAGKKNGGDVEIPILPPLQAALDARPVIGQTYLLTDYGQPFKSVQSLARKFKKWCKEAGIENRTANGIRKGAGHLLAQQGASEYEIMTIHGHARASTSHVYTKGVQRRQLSESALAKLANLDW